MAQKPTERYGGIPPRLAFALAVVLVAALALFGVARSSGDDAPTPSRSTTSRSTTTAEGGDGTAADDERPFLEITPLQGRPAAVAYGSGALWVADDRRGQLAVLDPENGAFLSEAVTVGPSPIALAHHAGVLWVADATGVVHRVDTTVAEPTTSAVEVGGALVDITAGAGGVFALDIESSLLHRLDPATGEILATAHVPSGVVRAAADDDELWITGLEDTVTPVSLDDLAIGTPVRVGRGPIGVTVVDGRVWVANSDSDTVTVIDAVTHEVLDAGRSVGSAPIAVVPDRDVVWVISQDAQEALPLSARTTRPEAEPFDLGGRPRGGTVSPAGLWLAAVDPSAAILVPRY